MNQMTLKGLIDEVGKTTLPDAAIANLIKNKNTHQKKLYLAPLVSTLWGSKLIDDKRVNFLENTIKFFNNPKYYIPTAFACYLNENGSFSRYPEGITHELFKQADFYITSSEIIAAEPSFYLLNYLFNPMNGEDSKNNQTMYQIKNLPFPDALAHYINRNHPASSKVLKEINAQKDLFYVMKYLSNPKDPKKIQNLDSKCTVATIPSIW